MRAALHRPQRNWGARLREHDVAGLRAVVLENEHLRVGILADRGTDLYELLYKPLDLDFAWLSSSGVRDPRAYAPGCSDPLGSFVDTYPGGWQEVLPNGGAPSTYAGASYGQHGEVSLVAWDYDVVADDEREVAVRFTVTGRKCPLRIAKEIRLAAGEATFRIGETLANESDVATHAMWGHHVTFGRPFLRPGCRILLPDGVEAIPHAEALDPDGRRRVAAARFAWPHARDESGGDVALGVLPEPGTPSELLYLTGFSHGRYEVVRPGGPGLRVEWDATVMPYLWFWQEFGGTTGYPWYGRHYNIGLEPFSSYPTNGLAEAVANGTAIALEPRARLAFWLSATVLAGN